MAAEKGPPKAQGTATDPTAEKLNLRLVAAEMKKLQSPIVGTGTVFAHKTSKIGPLVEGQVVNVHVKVGDRVQKGDLLFKIRPDNYRFAYDEAKARVTMAEARIIEVKPAVERAKSLNKRKNLSQAQLDKTLSALALARAEVASAKIKVEQARKNLDDTAMKAPFTGVVTYRFADEGIYLSNRFPGSNSAVIELTKIDIVTAIIQVPSHELEKLYVGAPVKLKIDGISAPMDATISIINDKVDIATRTVEVRIRIENSNYAIKPGLFVRAEILPRGREAIIIPRQAVRGSREARYLFIHRDGKAVRKNVRIIDFDATRVEIVSGLSENERVLTGPDLLRLRDGLAIGEVPNVAR